MHLTHFTGALSLRPLSRLSVRGNVSYDGRDDATTPLAISYIVTDTFPGGTAVTPRYSEDRTRADGSADYTLARWLRVGVGGSYDDKHYGPGQILTSSREMLGWGRATLTPLDSLSLTVKAGGGGTRGVLVQCRRPAGQRESPAVRIRLRAAGPQFRHGDRLVGGDVDSHLDGRGVAGEGRLPAVHPGPVAGT